MRLVNLSHGDWLIVAAYLCVTLLTMIPGIAPFWSLVIVVPLMYAVATWAAGAAEPRLGAGGRTPWHGADVRPDASAARHVRPVDRAGQGMLLVFSSDAATIRNELSYSAIRLSPDLSLSTLRFGFFCAAAVLLGALALWMRSTHIGCAIRAASDDAEGCRLDGHAHLSHLRCGQRRGARLGVDRRLHGRHDTLCFSRSMAHLFCWPSAWSCSADWARCGAASSVAYCSASCKCWPAPTSGRQRSRSPATF